MIKKLMYGVVSVLFLGVASQAAQPQVDENVRAVLSAADSKRDYLFEFLGDKYYWKDMHKGSLVVDDILYPKILNYSPYSEDNIY